MPPAAAAQTAPAALPAPAVALDTLAPANIPIVGNDGNRWWPIIAVVNGVGWLLTLVYLAWSRARRRDRPARGLTVDGRERPAFKALLNACSSGNAPQARQTVIDWTAAVCAQPGLASLAQVSAAFADPAMDAALASLNEALYGNAPTSWDGAALAEAARRLRSKHRSATRPQETPLQLYPQAG